MIKTLTEFVKSKSPISEHQILQMEDDNSFVLAAMNEGKRLYQEWLNATRVVIDGEECVFFTPIINPVLMGRRTHDAESEEDIDFKDIALNEMERLISITPGKD